MIAREPSAANAAIKRHRWFSTQKHAAVDVAVRVSTTPAAAAAAGRENFRRKHVGSVEVWGTEENHVFFLAIERCSLSHHHRLDSFGLRKRNVVRAHGTELVERSPHERI